MANCRTARGNMLLAIDAGNTRTKWAVFNKLGEVIQYDACLNSEMHLANLSPNHLGYQQVIISNVAGEQHAALLTEKLSTHHRPIHWIKSAPQANHVLNRYSKPETLGTDRWAALVAAWNMKHAPCVVINAGTAVTIDALNLSTDNLAQQGEFIGGLILPGLSLMQQSLGLATAQLPKTSKEYPVIAQADAGIFATNTVDAIQSGALHAIVGAITLMLEALQIQSKHRPAIIISGGNAKVIYEYLSTHVTNPISIVDNLVLQGLFLLESTMPTNSAQSELL